jgi:hypothetical protein
MSLISSASVWINDEPTKKRTPTMRKTIKRPPSSYNSQNSAAGGEADEYSIPAPSSQNYRDAKPESMQDVQAAQENRALRITEILNSINEDNDGNKLADFKPILNPAMSSMKPAAPVIQADTVPPFPQNPLGIRPPATRPRETSANYTPDSNADLAKLSSYVSNYQPPAYMADQRPHYSKLGAGGGENKLMEKINYMIHMLEDIQGERTNNTTEEFILYTFLGVFIIFIVDSFARSGRYIR